MDRDGVPVRTADRDHGFFPSAFCLFFDFLDQLLRAVQTNPSLDPDPLQDFLDHRFVCRAVLSFSHCSRSVSAGCRSRFRFRCFARRLCVCISGKNIEIIRQTVHIFLCPVVRAELHADQRQRALRSSRHSTGNINLRRKTALTRENKLKFFRLLIQCLQSVDLLLQNLRLVIGCFVVSAIRISHACHHCNQMFLNTFQHMNGIRVFQHGLYKPQMTCQLVNSSHKLDTVV